MQSLRGGARLLARHLAMATIAVAPLALVGCPSNNNQCGTSGGNGGSGGTSGGGDAGFGGPVSGPVDNHCYLLPDGNYPGGPVAVQPVQWFACPLDDAGYCTITLPNGADGGPCPDYGPTNYNSEANDDDCKYQVGWWSTPIQYNPGGANATCSTGPCVTFFASAKYTADGTPMTGNPASSANDEIVAEIESNSGNGLPPPNIGDGKMHEIQPGVYESDPLALNVHGQWQVRFHFNEECIDGWDSSPHGHAAFYFTVP